MVTETLGDETCTFAHRRSFSRKQAVIRRLGMACSYMALIAVYPGVPMAAAADAANASAADAASADAASADDAPKAALADTAPDQNVPVEEVVVNGVRQRDTVLPTRMKSQSVYGLDLDIMDTPRNTTLISPVQLDALNIRDVRAFSYLTASSYTESTYGAPNAPEIRGQSTDVFYNGMRSNFTQAGYGAPLTFNSVETVDISKGPASVMDGPGPGVGGHDQVQSVRASDVRHERDAALDRGRQHSVDQ